jgi:hypothetical protein
VYRQFVASSATPWRQIAKLNKIEFCKALKSGSSHHIVRDYIIYLRTLVPTFFKECPRVFPYRFQALNINESLPDDDGKRWFKLPLANGIYRTTIKLGNENDTDALQIQFQSENNFVQNMEIFN